MVKNLKKRISTTLLTTSLLVSMFTQVYAETTVENNPFLQNKPKEQQTVVENNPFIHDDKKIADEELKIEDDYDESTEKASRSGTSGDQGVISLTFNPDGPNKGFYHKDVAKILSGTENEREFINKIVEAIRPYIKDGFANLWNQEYALDNIYGGAWARYLEPFYGKPLKEYSNQPLILPFDKVTYRIKMDENSKKWVHEQLMPEIQAMIEEESKPYAMYEFKLDYPRGVSLVDFDNKILEAMAQGKSEGGYKAIPVAECMPMTGYVNKQSETTVDSNESSSKVYDAGDEKDDDANKTYYIVNMGNEYGFTLNGDYLKILKGYKNMLYDYISIDVDGKKGRAPVVAYLARIRDLEGATLKDKQWENFPTLDGNYAVNLKTKDLVDSTGVESQKSLEKIEDLGLKKENLILINTDRGPMLINSFYREAYDFPATATKYLTGKTLDIKEFLKSDNPKGEYLEGGTYDINEYIYPQGTARIQIDEINNNKNQMTIFKAPDKLDWKEVVKWSFEEYAGKDNPEKQEKLQKIIKSEMEAQGKLGKYNSYLEAAGQMTDTTKNILPIIIIAIVGVSLFIIVAIIKRKIKKSKEKQLLFDDKIYENQVKKSENKDDFNDIDFDVF